jgi:hypothetical protein
MSPAQKHRLAVHNGRAGGRAWAGKAAQPNSSSYGGCTALEERAAKMRQRTIETYGALFCNIVKRNPRGPKPGTKYRPRRKKNVAAQPPESSQRPVVFYGN